MVPEVVGSRPIFHPTDEIPVCLWHPGICQHSWYLLNNLKISSVALILFLSETKEIIVRAVLIFMIHHVYIIYSQSRDIFYTGITSNISKRLQYHNNAKEGFTKVGRPWKILWTTTKPSIEEAKILEQKIKNLSHLRKINFMKKYFDGIADQQILMGIKNKMI